MNMRVAGALIAGAILFASSAANAVVISQDQSGSGNNVLFNSCSGNANDAAMVQGCLNAAPTAYIDFTGTETLHGNGGQAVITAADGAFNDVTIGFNDPTFGMNTLVLNINAASDGHVHFVITFLSGEPTFVSGLFEVDGGGENFFTIDGVAPELIDTIQVIGDDVLFDDLRQVRVDGPATLPAIPEPASLTLLGGALVGLGLICQRRRRKAA